MVGGVVVNTRLVAIMSIIGQDRVRAVGSMTGGFVAGLVGRVHFAERQLAGHTIRVFTRTANCNVQQRKLNPQNPCRNVRHGMAGAGIGLIAMGI